MWLPNCYYMHAHKAFFMPLTARERNLSHPKKATTTTKNDVLPPLCWRPFIKKNIISINKTCYTRCTHTKFVCYCCCCWTENHFQNKISAELYCVRIHKYIYPSARRAYTMRDEKQSTIREMKTRARTAMKRADRVRYKRNECGTRMKKKKINFISTAYISKNESRFPAVCVPRIQHI